MFVKENCHIKNKKDVSLLLLFLTFFKIGATSFGGFISLISVIQKDLTEKKGLVKDKVIIDGVSLASVLPGPMAVNVVAYIGYYLKGIKGALVSMLGILLPSFALILILSLVYFEYGQLPELETFFRGVLPAVAAIIVSVAINMSKKHIRDAKQVFIVLLTIIAILFIKSIFITSAIILVGGLLGYFLYKNTNISKSNTIEIIPKKKNIKQLFSAIGFVIIIMLSISILSYLSSGKAYPSTIVLKDLMITFSSLGVTTFGGGYVVIPVMQEIFVSALGWLTQIEFVDSIAMGQLTPGPIFISATFIGYKVGGFLGAITATFFVFVPPSLIMVICSAFFHRMRGSITIKAAFKGLRPAVIGMILASAYSIFVSTSFSWMSLLVFASVLISSTKYKVDVVFLIPLSGLVGLLFF